MSEVLYSYGHQSAFVDYSGVKPKAVYGGSRLHSSRAWCRSSVLHSADFLGMGPFLKEQISAVYLCCDAIAICRNCNFSLVQSAKEKQRFQNCCLLIKHYFLLPLKKCIWLMIKSYWFWTLFEWEIRTQLFKTDSNIVKRNSLIWIPCVNIASGIKADSLMSPVLRLSHRA